MVLIQIDDLMYMILFFWGVSFPPPQLIQNQDGLQTQMVIIMTSRQDSPGADCNDVDDDAVMTLRLLCL